MLCGETATLRQAHVSEATAIARMSRLHVEHGLRWRWTPRRVKRSIRDPESITLVATIKGDLAGFAIMKFGDADAHLHLLAVNPLHRRAGVATAMLGWLETSCVTAGIQRIRLEVRAANLPARHFYEQCGFRIRGQIAGYYGHSESALVYGKTCGRRLPS